MLVYRTLAGQIVCTVIFCFVFSTRFTHGHNGSHITPSLIPAPATFSQLPISSNAMNASGSVNVTSFPIKPNVTTSVTSKSVTPKPFKTTAKQISEDSGRKFDGLSFFGGMILGAAICIILLFGVKYYQVKKRSYHSL